MKPNLSISWHLTFKNITDKQQCVQFQKSQNSAVSHHPTAQYCMTGCTVVILYLFANFENVHMAVNQISFL